MSTFPLCREKSAEEEETMELEITRSAETSVLKLKGNWTLERASELKPALLDVLEKNESLVIDVAELTCVDLAAMQLFCSAHNASVRMGKQLTFSERKSEPLRRMVRDAGLVRTVGCNRNPNQNCLWTGDWTS
jgi:anti-anti-sigma regulatory factor